MARLLYDIPNRHQAAQFPTHGWAKNSQGVKLLWFPILRLFSNVQLIRGNQGAKPLAPGVDHDTLPFYETLRKLAQVLKELHSLIRKRADAGNHTEDQEYLQTFLESAERIPLCVDLAYVYLVRLAHHLIAASRLVLFEYYDGATTKFQKLRKKMEEQDGLAELNPICNAPLLYRAFKDHSSWFDLLRATGASGRTEGIRDVLEHGLVRMLVGGEKTGSEPWTTSVILISRSRDEDRRQELISELRVIVAGLCNLLAGIHAAVGWGTGYEWRDTLILSGDDDDTTGFWPEIPDSASTPPSAA